MRDPYAVLGVERSATEADIRSAFRSLARKYHPDVNKEPEAADRFNEITEAYELLGDPERRAAFDRFGHTDTAGPRQTSGPTVDVSSIFEDLFGARGPGSGFGTQGPFGAGGPGGARRGRDLEHRLAISFLTSVRGGSEQVRLDIGGSSQTIDVKIPAGIEDGATLRVEGRGHPGMGGGRPGDLRLTVEVGKHPWFRRDGRNLLVDIPITITEAALGATVEVPLLDGSADVRIPAGARSGQKLRIREQGIRTADGKAGDLHAVIQIVAPDDLNDADTETLRDLGERLENPRRSAPWADAAKTR